jgi:hypothetical protein
LIRGFILDEVARRRRGAAAAVKGSKAAAVKGSKAAAASQPANARRLVVMRRSRQESTWAAKKYSPCRASARALPEARAGCTDNQKNLYVRLRV